MHATTLAHVQRIEKTRTRITVGVWLDAVVVMIFSLVTSYQLLHGDQLNTPGATAWMLGFAVDVALCIALVGDQVLQRLGVESRWGRVLRWTTMLMSLFLNTATSWGLGSTKPIDWTGVVTHSLAPVLLVVLTEYAQDVQLHLTRLLEKLQAEQDQAEERRRREIEARRAAELTEQREQERAAAAERREKEEAQARERAAVVEAQARAAEAAAQIRREELAAEARRAELDASARRAELEARTAQERADAERARAAADQARAEADRVRAEGQRARLDQVSRQGQQVGQTQGQTQSVVSVEEAARVAMKYHEEKGELPGQKQLAGLAKCSDSTAKRALRQLRATTPLRAAGTR